MNFNYYISFDYESVSVDPHTTQPLSLGAVIIEPRKLEIVPNSEFYSLIKPSDPDKVEAKALEVNKLKMEDLMKAPDLKTVWNNFVQYVEKYNKNKSKFTAPVPMGYNIERFDLIITDRLMKQFGTKTLFHCRDTMDLMKDFYRWTENNPKVKSISLDTVREMLGIATAGKHNALEDAKDCAAIGIRMLSLYRNIKVKFENSFAIKN